MYWAAEWIPQWFPYSVPEHSTFAERYYCLTPGTTLGLALDLLLFIVTLFILVSRISRMFVAQSSMSVTWFVSLQWTFLQLAHAGICTYLNFWSNKSTYWSQSDDFKLLMLNLSAFSFSTDGVELSQMFRILQNIGLWSDVFSGKWSSPEFLMFLRKHSFQSIWSIVDVYVNPLFSN